VGGSCYCTWSVPQNSCRSTERQLEPRKAYREGCATKADGRSASGEETETMRGLRGVQVRVLSTCVVCLLFVYVFIVLMLCSHNNRSTEWCGQCNACKDSPRFGGENKHKQTCIYRRCLDIWKNRAPGAARLGLPGGGKSMDPLKQEGSSQDREQGNAADDDRGDDIQEKWPKLTFLYVHGHRRSYTLRTSSRTAAQHLQALGRNPCLGGQPDTSRSLPCPLSCTLPCPLPYPPPCPAPPEVPQSNALAATSTLFDADAAAFMQERYGSGGK
jgi:hypothetical protein